MSYQQTKYEKDDPRNTDPIVSKTLGDSYWVVREIYKNLPFLRFLSDKVANLDIQNVEFQSNTEEQRIEWKYENQTTWNVLVSYEDLLADSLAQALMPINAELESQADIMDAFAVSLNNITSTLNAQSNTINSTIQRVEALEEGNETFAGWVPILSLVPDGQRLVMQITDWTGGVGTKPPVNVYVGLEGYVTDIAEAENLKGDQGVAGSQGIQGVKGDKGDKGDDGEAGADGVGVPVGGTTGQILAKVSNTDLDTQWIDPPEGEGGGTPGADGKSAYEIAVENGFLGTEVEWLASLKGEQGEQGTPGINGDNGLSAYEVAVSEGFVGDETAWLLSLKGEKGDTGDAGATELAGLTDVDLTTPPTDGQVLVYDVATETWIAGDQTGGSGGGGGVGPQPTTSPVDLSLYIAGKPDASEVIYRTILARELTIAGDMAGSKGFAEVNPTTAAAAFSLQRNGVTVGQIIFGITGTVAFTTNGPGDPQVFAVDDLLSVVAPSTPNATMADISLTLAFTREA